MATSLEFLDYFAYRLIQEPNDTSAREMLNLQIHFFFNLQMNKETINQLEHILLNTYSIV